MHSMPLKGLECSSEYAEVKRKVLREVLNCERERTAVSDVSEKVVPDKGSLNRERPATKALKFPSCTRKSSIFVCFCF